MSSVKTIIDRPDGVAMAEKAEEAARMLAILAHPKRLLVLCALVEGERSAGDLADLVGLGQSATSQHLGRMRDLDLVATRRSGQTIFYRLASPRVEAILETLHAIYCGDGRRTGSTGSDPADG